MVDGSHASAFAAASHTHGQGDVTGAWSNPQSNAYAVSTDVASFAGTYVGTVVLTIGGTAYTLIKI